MHYEQYYQIATEAKFIEMGVNLADLSTCRAIQQAPSAYSNMRGLTEPFQIQTGMLIRHLEFSNGYMQAMWAKASETGDTSMLPFKKEELEIILANEPSEV